MRQAVGCVSQAIDIDLKCRQPNRRGRIIHRVYGERVGLFGDISFSVTNCNRDVGTAAGVCRVGNSHCTSALVDFNRGKQVAVGHIDHVERKILIGDKSS